MTARVPPRLPVPPSQPPVLIPPLLAKAARPRVVLLYRIWCALFLVFYVQFGVEKILVARGVIEPHFGLIEGYLSEHSPNLRADLVAEKRADAPGFAGLLFSIALFYLAAMMIPRKPWAWLLGVVALATTVFPFFITAAGTGPLLLFWVRPEVKCYFGRPV